MSPRISRRNWQGELQRLGDEAFNRGDFLAAAELYEGAMMPDRETSGLRMSAGHMRKEGKDFAAAEAHYLRVLALIPDDPEIHLQLGHFYKTVGRYLDAQQFYSSALARGYADRDVVLHELSGIQSSEGLRRERHRSGAAGAEGNAGLIGTKLLPPKLDQIRRVYHETFVISRLGNVQTTIWGRGHTVRGVDAFRGHIITSVPCRGIEVFLDDQLVHAEPLDCVPLRWEASPSGLRKYVFNAWIDFTAVSRGRHDVIFRATPLDGDARHGIEWRRETVIVADPIAAECCADSPAFIPSLDPDSPLSVEEQVNALPSLVHHVTASGYPGKLDAVAVMRLDQLGDMVVTLPAMRRLRDLLPESRIVGLMSPANAGLARTLGIFDEVVEVGFPDDKYQHKRVMHEREQLAFKEMCSAYRFDLALDFLYSEHANKLLPLTGAPITMTVSRSDHVESLEVAFDARSPGGGGCLSPMTHTAKARALSEALALWLNNDARPLPRQQASGEQLARYGLVDGERFVVLHTGSSFAQFLRWPHYPELAIRLLEAGYKVLYMAGDPSQQGQLPSDALSDGRIIYLSNKIPFDDLDALLANASLMIGNDSGPKHWASLRGTKVVSIHPGRDDLREWGQVFGGVVLGRRVPCAGCGIRYDETECGKNFVCVTEITVEEVLREALALQPE